MTETATFTPSYSPWRHGGWYVDNVRYPSGAVGCVSRNYADRKWRIACDKRKGSYPDGPNDHTYPSRDAAALAEYELANAEARGGYRLRLHAVGAGESFTIDPVNYPTEEAARADLIRVIRGFGLAGGSVVPA